MNSVYLETLNLLSDSLHSRVSISMKYDVWPKVYKELQAHAVTALVANSISSMNLSSEDRLVFMKVLGVGFQRYNNILIEQTKILDSLHAAGINVAVLKGTSASKYYPNPEYRTMGDIDLLVNPKDFENAREILSSLGLTYIHKSDVYERHVAYVNAHGLEIELHRYFSSVGYEEQRIYLDNHLYDGLASCSDSTLNEVDNGLVLIGHVAHHLRSGLGLRQIIDWMMYVEANLSDEFWHEEFFVPARKCGFDKLAKVTTAVCRKYLGLSLDISWCDDINDDLIDSFMEYIMDQGNFGCKHERGERSAATVLINFRNPVSLLKYLQAGGKTHWKLARTNKFFCCFAWLYQIGHIIRMGLRRKIGIKALKNSRKVSQGIVELMNELDIE